MLEPIFHRVGSPFDRGLRRWQLIGEKAAQDVIDGVSTGWGPANAHSEARKVLAAQRLNDGLQPVVSASAASGTHSDNPQR